MARKPESELETATRAIRGLLRYRNEAVVQVIAMLLQGVDEAGALLQANVDTLGAMVIVDPEYEHLWRDRINQHRITISTLKSRAELVREATVRAKDQLTNPEQGNERPTGHRRDQGADQSG